MALSILEVLEHQVIHQYLHYQYILEVLEHQVIHQYLHYRKLMGEKKSVFLVEDDLSFGAVLKSYLEISNFSVHWVDDGKYAIERFRDHQFHLCLLDVMLPNVDGFTIGREIRSIDMQIPIIYLTTCSTMPTNIRLTNPKSK